MKQILCITGNEDKFKEFQKMISVKLKRKKIDLPELQGTPEEIVKEKSKLACRITKKPCFVDDTSLCFEEWGGLPGPYIKHFIESLGDHKLAKTLLASGNNRAKAITSIGFCEPGKKPVCIQGTIKGRITLPKGKLGFEKGWSKIFIPDGSSKSHAEMTIEEKKPFSQRKKAIIAFEKFLKRLN
jgi:inosine triphosphate pyrophosphatase